MTASTLTTGESADRAEVTEQRPGLSRHFVRSRRFLSTYGWLARDGLLCEKRRVIDISVASVVGAAAQGGAIGLLVLFISVIESGGTTGVSALDNVIGSNLSSLILVTLLLIAMYFISAAAQFFAARQARRIAREYHDRTVARALGLYCGAALLDTETLASVTTNARQVLANRPKIMGKSLEAMVRSINPACSFLVAVGAMAVINLPATLVIAPVFLLLLPVLYGVSHRIQRHANEFYGTSSKGMAQGARACFKLADSTNVHGERVRRQVVDRWTTDEGVRSGLDSYDDVLLGPARSAFSVSLFRPVAISVVLLVLGYQALQGELPWSLLLGYLAALRQATGFLESLAGNLAMMNKFYRRVAEHKTLYTALRDGGGPAVGVDVLPERITIRSQEIIGGGLARTNLVPGAPFLYFHPAALGRLTLSALCEPLARRGSEDLAFWQAARFMTDAHAFTEGSIAANVLGTDDVPPARLDELTAVLDGLGLSGSIAALPRGLASGDVELDGLGPELTAALKVLAVRSDPAPAAFLELNILRRVDPALVPRLLALLDDRYVVLTTSRPDASAPMVEQVVVSQDTDIAGIGDHDWWCAHRAELARATPEADGVSDDEDDEDE